jgi:hypothetical protein
MELALAGYRSRRFFSTVSNCGKFPISVWLSAWGPGMKFTSI